MTRSTPFGRSGQTRSTPFGRSGQARSTPFGRSGQARSTPFGCSGQARSTPQGGSGPPSTRPARSLPRRITFVKKILEDGSPCPKCADVEARLHERGQMAMIDRVVIADMRDPKSEGMAIAAAHEVERAPFFVVEDATGTRVYTVYFKFAKEVLGAGVSAQEEAHELLRDNPDLDFV